VLETGVPLVLDVVCSACVPDLVPIGEVEVKANGEGLEIGLPDDTVLGRACGFPAVDASLDEEMAGDWLSAALTGLGEPVEAGLVEDEMPFSCRGGFCLFPGLTKPFATFRRASVASFRSAPEPAPPERVGIENTISMRFNFWLAWAVVPGCNRNESIKPSPILWI
jgi:hypothetical protein